MSRLYDRLMTLGCSMPGVAQRGLNVDLQGLDECVVIDTSNVCQYYFEGTGQEEWDVHEFPNLAPPFRDYWMEMRSPKTIVSDVFGTRSWESDAPRGWGLRVSSQDVKDIENLGDDEMVSRMAEQRQGLDNLYGDKLREMASMGSQLGLSTEQFWEIAELRYGEKTAKNLKSLAMMHHAEELVKSGEIDLHNMFSGQEEFRWSVQYTLFLEYAKGQIQGPVIHWKFLIDPQGKATHADQGMIGIYVPGLSPEECHTLNDVLAKFLHPALLATSFLHCKNVSLDENKPPAKPSKKHERRYGVPLTRYYTLEIEPMRQTLRQEGDVSNSGLKRALHICRGHFATYSPEKPLFGKYAGTFWKPQHVKGNKASGEVVKDYAVKAPQS